MLCKCHVINCLWTYNNRTIRIVIQLLRVTLTKCLIVRASMKTRLRNVTVTLEDDVALWARLEAARQDTSVSRLLGEILKTQMLEQNSYQRAMRRALARKPFLHTDGDYLSREEAHDRAHLR